jgi:vanillate O-demethylase ferredoxin subunit
MPDNTIRVHVAEKTGAAVDICSLTLVAENGRLPESAPGAHIDVHLPGGLIRQYSLCQEPDCSGHYLIGVLRDPQSRGGSIAIHDRVQKGDLLEISPPKNHFQIVQTTRPTVLLAGGIGITPIIPMADWLAANNAPFEMHYCTRERPRTAFYDRIMASPYASCVHFHFDNEPVDQRLDLDNLLRAHANGAHLYVCGPRGFIDAALASAERHTWPADHVHFERFSNAQALFHDEDAGFFIEIRSTGQRVFVPPDQTASDALRSAGIAIATSCEQGVCGTCLTTVIDGIPDHRDMFLTDAERLRNDRFTPCCSCARTPVLVVDL